MFAGKVTVFNRTRQLAHPDYQLLDADEGREAVDAFAGRLIPLYPACKQMHLLEDRQVRGHRCSTASAGPRCGDPLPDRAARRARACRRCPRRCEQVHRPRHPGRHRRRPSDRLKWDEAFVLQVALARRRAADSALPAVRPGPGGRRTARRPSTRGCRSPSPTGQRKVTDEIFADLATEHPMHRLLQGEVGSGKTAGRAAGDARPSSTPAGRPRCWRPPRCWPSSTTGRSPR